MPKQKPPSFDPQTVKEALLLAAARLGKRRRRMRASELFELIIDCARK